VWRRKQLNGEARKQNWQTRGRDGRTFAINLRDPVVVRIWIVLFVSCGILAGWAQDQPARAEQLTPADQSTPLVSAPDSTPAVSAPEQSTDDWLRIYVVEINGLSGIYLGNGLIMTAAHVVGGTGTRLDVGIADLQIQAKVIRAGKFDDVDLSLLSLDASKLPIWLRLRRLEFCEKPPQVGQPVTVAAPASTARSTIASPMILAPDLRKKFPTLIKDVETIGNSGAGVFAAGRKCLYGIVSRKLQTSPKAGEGAPANIVKYFVPAATIWAFIPSWYRSRGLSVTEPLGR
jgi:hypothetical protein